MKKHISTKTANRFAITPIGKAFSFAFFGMLFLMLVNTNVRGQTNNMTGQYIGSGNAPITLFNCTDPDDNGIITATSNVLNITETIPGTVTGTLNLTVVTDIGTFSGAFGINSTAALGNPRIILGTMQSQTPPLTLFNGNFGGSWSQVENKKSITKHLSKSNVIC